MDTTDEIRGLTREVLADEFVPLARYRFEQRRRDGTWQAVNREVYERDGGAVALLYDPEGGTVLLVRQFRLPVHLAGGNGHILAAPAGFLDGIDPEARMRAELLEETGYRVGALEHLFDLFMSPAYVPGAQSFFLGEYRRGERAEAGGGVVDEGEDIAVEHIPLAEAVAMIGRGEIVCGKTVILVMALVGRRGGA